MTWSLCILRTTNVSQLEYHSLLLLWNNYTIHRLMHLWIHKLSKLSIPRVWNLPSTQSIDCRICQSVEWESANCTIHWLNNLSIHDWQSAMYWLTDSTIYRLCDWHILQSMHCAIGRFLSLQIHRFCNLWILCLADSTLEELTNFSIDGLTDEPIYELSVESADGIEKSVNLYIVK